MSDPWAAGYLHDLAQRLREGRLTPSEVLAAAQALDNYGDTLNDQRPIQWQEGLSGPGDGDL